MEFLFCDVLVGVIVVNGLLVFVQILIKCGQYIEVDGYLWNVIMIVEDMLVLCFLKEQVFLEMRFNGGVLVVFKNGVLVLFESILRNLMVIWNKYSQSWNGDYGLVYVDYYLIEFGNCFFQFGYYC